VAIAADGFLARGTSATALIVSLGVLHQPWQLGVLMLAVGLLVVQGIAINRLAGIDYPLWSPRSPEPRSAPPPSASTSP
jgi:CBS domain-containing membrane protein